MGLSSARGSHPRVSISRVLAPFVLILAAVMESPAAAGEKPTFEALLPSAFHEKLKAYTAHGKKQGSERSWTQEQDACILVKHLGPEKLPFGRFEVDGQPKPNAAKLRYHKRLKLNVVDPIAETVAFVETGVSGDDKWEFIAECSGKLYCPPSDENSVLVIGTKHEMLRSLGLGGIGDEEGDGALEGS